MNNMKVEGFILCKCESFKPLILARVSVRTGFIAIIIDDTTQCYRSFLLSKEAKILLKNRSKYIGIEKKEKEKKWQLFSSYKSDSAKKQR